MYEIKYAVHIKYILYHVQNKLELKKSSPLKQLGQMEPNLA
jgi:hypothetical protein